MDKTLLATTKEITNEKSEQLELVEEFKQEIEDLKGIIHRIMKHKTTKKSYEEYIRLGGISDEIEFRIHLKKFYELTLNIYVYGRCLNFDGTYCKGRRDAWKKWALYIGCFHEADLYYQAVDNIGSYS